MSILSDPDPSETREWIDSLRAVVHYQGPERAAYLPEVFEGVCTDLPPVKKR
jgi:pyruvate dehydrogenase complex dehydrogenase (E1) component